jgi:DNA-binding MarR family transcriptional regulator
VGTKHNLSVSGPGPIKSTNEQQVCIFCHTPHNASPIQPLWNRPEGVRLTELAQTARITKQSMGALVDSLELGGYVERVDDPDDARAWRVRLTSRGRQYGRDVRKFAQETEKSVANRIGARRLQELRKTLALFVESKEITCGFSASQVRLRIPAKEHSAGLS